MLEHMEVNAVFMPDYEGTRPEYDSFLEALAGRDGVQRMTRNYGPDHWRDEDPCAGSRTGGYICR